MGDGGRGGGQGEEIPTRRQNLTFPFPLSSQNEPLMDCALHFRRLGHLCTAVTEVCKSADQLVAQPGPVVQDTVHALAIPGLSHLQESTREKLTHCFPRPNSFPLKNTRCPNQKPSCLQESQFDCRCFIFLVHHTNHSWPCAIIACFSLRSPPSAAIYIQGCAALITEPFVTNAFQDG